MRRDFWAVLTTISDETSFIKVRFDVKKICVREKRSTSKDFWSVQTNISDIT